MGCARGIRGTTNRITSSGYSYDNNGNLTAMPGVAMSYDVENRMSSATHSANGTEYYVYGPSNERVWKRIEYPGGTSANFVYFYGADGALLTTNGISNATDYNVYFAGRQIWAEGSSGSPHSVSPDRLGSMVKHFPYGDEPTTTTPNRTKFATYYRDVTTLDYARNRYYSSTIARFTTADPYGGSARPGNPQSWNRYTYVGGDPVNFNDPSGLDWWDPGASTLHGDPPDPVAMLHILWVYSQGSFYDDWQRYAMLDYWASAVEAAASIPLSATSPDGVPRASKEQLTSGAAGLLANSSKCAGFVTEALRGGFLDVFGASSPDQLDSDALMLYYGLSTNSVLQSLSQATFFTNVGSVPAVQVGTQTYTTYARADFVWGGVSSIYFYDPAWGSMDMGFSWRLTIHEGMHLVHGIGDLNFARAVGVYRVGMTPIEASAAWNAKLTENCK